MKLISLFLYTIHCLTVYNNFEYFASLIPSLYSKYPILIKNFVALQRCKLQIHPYPLKKDQATLKTTLAPWRHNSLFEWHNEPGARANLKWCKRGASAIFLNRSLDCARTPRTSARAIVPALARSSAENLSASRVGAKDVDAATPRWGGSGPAAHSSFPSGRWFTSAPAPARIETRGIFAAAAA